MHWHRLVAIALLATVASVSRAQGRTQLECTVAMPPAAAAARVLSIFADERFTVEQSDPALIVAEVPVAPRDAGGRAATQALVRALLVPVGSDSTQVVLTGQLLVPQPDALPSQRIAVSEETHPTYGKTNRHVWAAMERVATAIHGDGACPGS
jgi:hypothetical protein